VWVYARRARLPTNVLSTLLSDSAFMTAVAMPASMLVQFSLVTTLAPTATSLFALALSMAAMTVPYVFAGITISLALTRSPYAGRQGDRVHFPRAAAQSLRRQPGLRRRSARRCARLRRGRRAPRADRRTDGERGRGSHRRARGAGVCAGGPARRTRRAGRSAPLAATGERDRRAGGFRRFQRVA